MQQLITQLGIDWRLLLSQAINFMLLLVVLRIFAYKPLLKLMHDRQDRIDEGLVKAKVADERLHEIDMIGKGKIREAETQALKIIQKTENDARALEIELLNEVKRKETEAMQDSEAALRAREAESRRVIEKEAADLVRRAIAKTVQLAPEQIDNALVTQAVKEAKQSK
jgi:F-type H+-transporting ATPase subunit b